jgi:hypothetical protein
VGRGWHRRAVALFVHHDDANREFVYDRADKLQQFDKGWNEAVAKGWTVLSMKTTGRPRSAGNGSIGPRDYRGRRGKSDMVTF